MFIIEKLWEDGKLLPEELVGEVDGGVDDPGAVSADAVGDVADGDGNQIIYFSSNFTIAYKVWNIRIMKAQD